MLEAGVWNWVLAAEVDKMTHRAVAVLRVPQPVHSTVVRNLMFKNCILGVFTKHLVLQDTDNLLRKIKYLSRRWVQIF
jgi:hypothetical protein